MLVRPAGQERAAAQGRSVRRHRSYQQAEAKTSPQVIIAPRSSRLRQGYGELKASGLNTNHNAKRRFNSFFLLVRSINLKILIPALCYRAGVWFLLLYRRLRYKRVFRRIKLTQGQYAIVDAWMYEELNKYQWYAHKGKTTYYAYRAARIDEKRKSKNVKMHEEVMKLQKTDDRRLKTEDQKYVIDHINGDGLDNRSANLRVATYSQNSQNRRKSRKGCGSKYKGVWLDKRTRRWRAQICFEGTKKHLGYYDDEAGAARAYDRAAVRYHEEFAKLNFPQHLNYGINRLLGAGEILRRRKN